MKRQATQVLVGTIFLAAALQAYAQPNYPTRKPTPKASPTQTTSPSPNAQPQAEPAPTPSKPKGPLKMITTDGTNKQSPIRVTALDFYDEGYGTRYNAEVRVSGSVQNNSKTAELKKVVVKLQIVDQDNQVIQEWKEIPGTLKPMQSVRIQPPVWRNSLGTLLKARFQVEHEEVDEKDAKKDGSK